MKPIIKVENLSKQYRLGNVGTGTLSNDLKRWWHKVRGQEDPFLKIGESNDRTTKGGSEYVWALKDINFEVMPGEVLGIIGKNGAGKSTLLKILSKVTGPTTGRIDFNGRIGSLLEVGTGFHPELTGRENIYLNGAILGMTKAEINRKLDEIIDFSGCERYIDTPVKRYSSGMTVRLGFAVAAHLEPEILVVDEVLAVGDAEFQKKAIGKMQDVSKNEGRTVLFVSHNMASIQQLCQTGLILSNGTISFSGKISEAIQRYMMNEEKIHSLDDEGFFDLDKIRDNVNSNNLFKKIRVLNNKNVPSKSFYNLESLKVEVILNDQVNNSSVDFCIAIKSIYDQWITSSATWMYNINRENNGKKLVFEIPTINFAPGIYYVYLSATLHFEGVYIDRINNAYDFSIESSDIFKSGREFSAENGILIPENRIQVI